MLTQERVDQIREMLAGGLNAREVAAMTGCARTTIQRIASGKRKDRTHRDPVGHFNVRSSVHRRCPECGGMVLMPCMECRIEREKRRRRKPILRGGDP